MDLEKLYEMGFSAEEIVSNVNNFLSSDDLCYIIYHSLVDADMEVPEEIEEHYELHCK